MIMTLFKVFGVVYPFVKELFFGKEDVKRAKARKATKPDRPMLKKTIIVLGIVSFLLCIFLGQRLWEVSKEYARLKKEKVPTPTEVVIPHVSTPEPVAPAAPASAETAVPVHTAVVRRRKSARIDDRTEHEELIKQLKAIE